MVKVGIDVMGGESPPEELIEGALQALNHYEKSFQLFLVGNETVIKKALRSKKYPKNRLFIVHAEDVITMKDSIRACKTKPESSLMVGCNALHKGVFDSFFTPGNTGASLTAALITIGRLNGVKRPALLAHIPTYSGKDVVVLDVGANVDCTPRYLKQFAIMGHHYYRCLFKKQSPRIGLLNIGEESSKGDAVSLKTYKLLERLPYKFSGNAEPEHVFGHDVDVVVCDGFVGNIFIKSSEAASTFMKLKLKQSLRQNKLAMPLAPLLKRILKDPVEKEKYGGAFLIGCNKPFYIGHGTTERKATFHTIKSCVDIVQHNLIDNIEADIHQWG